MTFVIKVRNLLILIDNVSMRDHNYFVYITTNPDKSVLYIGVTNNLARRIDEHYENRGKKTTFAGRYYCYKLIYYEHFQYIEHAIKREKELKGWRRAKKEKLIAKENPYWHTLNESLNDL